MIGLGTPSKRELAAGSVGQAWNRSGGQSVRRGETTRLVPIPRHPGHSDLLVGLEGLLMLVIRDVALEGFHGFLEVSGSCRHWFCGLTDNGTRLNAGILSMTAAMI